MTTAAAREKYAKKNEAEDLRRAFNNLDTKVRPSKEKEGGGVRVHARPAHRTLCLFVLVLLCVLHDSRRMGRCKYRTNN